VIPKKCHWEDFSVFFIFFTMNTIIFKWRDEFVRVNPFDIIYFRADGNYTIMTLTSQKERLLTMNLSKVFEILETQLGVHSNLFERVGRGLIIRKEYIFEIQILKKQLTLVVPENDIYFELQASKEALKKLKKNQEKKYKNNSKVQLRELQTRKTYSLIEGNNFFGRQSKQSKCNNQIDNGDNQMSRLHFNIIVHFEPEGGDFNLYISDLSSANGTFLNNNLIVGSKLQQLCFGDIIRAGKTEFVVECFDIEKTEAV
jgi:hypothetical protein